MYQDHRLITINDFDVWIKREYSSWGFARLTGDSEVTVFAPLADKEMIGLLLTQLEYMASVNVKVKFNTYWWSYPWHRFCKWWERF